MNNKFLLFVGALVVVGIFFAIQSNNNQPTPITNTNNTTSRPVYSTPVYSEPVNQQTNTSESGYSSSSSDETSDNQSSESEDNTDKNSDGTHTATVEYYNPATGYTGTYTLDVEVENGEVRQIDFPNGGYLDEDHITPAELDEDGHATIEGEDGKTYDVQVDDDK